MKTTWTATVEGKEIRITYGWFGGERLYVNGQLQDEKVSTFGTPTLTGHFIRGNGEKALLKANLYMTFGLRCSLFVDDVKVPVTKS